MNKDSRFMVQLTDPAGFDHYLEFFKGHLYGTENIAHIYTDKEVRERTTRKLIGLVSEAHYGNCHGYVWRRIDLDDY